MTATTHTHRAPTPHERSRTASPLTGAGLISRHIVRRDRVRMTVWALALAGFVAYFSVALSTVFDEAALAGRAAVMRTPSGIVMGGPGYGLQDYTPMVAVANEGTTWIVLGLSIMAILHVVRHTRAEEESSRAELVRAGAVGRLAPPIAAGLTLVGHLSVITLVGALATLAGGDDASLVDGIALMGGSALSALVFGAIALVAGEISASARGATGLSLAAFGLAFVVRAAGDLIEQQGSALSWFSPVAWAQQTRAFVDLRWWPLLLSVAATLVLLAVAALLARRRDFAQGLVAARAGRADAAGWLQGPVAMAWRQQRSLLLWCALGMGLVWFGTGTMMATIGDMGVDLVADNPALGQVFGTGPAGFTTAFLEVMLLVVSVCVAAYAMVATHQYCRSEETAGRLEIVLAAPVSRGRWFAAQLAVAGAGTVALLALSVYAIGAGSALVGVDEPDLAGFTTALMLYLPPTLVFFALSAALFAWVPKLAGLSWLLIAYVFLVGMFGAAFELPEWLLGISPYHWVSEPFADEIDVGGPLGLGAVMLALLVTALLGLRRRDTRSGQ